ncbi:radical SAM/SPASM domain-containing protein [Thermodesulfobacteriota bacterium]
MIESAFLVLTTRCTRTCPHCFYVTGHQSRVEVEMDADTVLGALEGLQGKGLRAVIITGGEPLLRDDLESIIAGSASMGLWTLLLTNGDLLTLERTAGLEAAGLDAVSLALDSLSEGSLKSARRVMTHLALRSGMDVTAITTLTRINAGELEAVMDLAGSLSAGHLAGPAFIPETSPAYPDLSLDFLDEEELDHLCGVLDAWAERTGATGYARLVKSLLRGTDTRPSRCTMGTASLVINPDGRVLPCFHREDLDCGNVTADNIDEVLARLRTLARPLWMAPCFGAHCVTLFTGFSS